MAHFKHEQFEFVGLLAPPVPLPSYHFDPSPVRAQETADLKKELSDLAKAAVLLAERLKVLSGS